MVTAKSGLPAVLNGQDAIQSFKRTKLVKRKLPCEMWVIQASDFNADGFIWTQPGKHTHENP